MSKIAEALAKAKEQTGHTTAPFLRGEAPVSSGAISASREAALKKAKRDRTFWMIVAPTAMTLSLGVIWLRWDDIFPTPQPDSKPAQTTLATTPATVDPEPAKTEDPTLGAPSKVVIGQPAPPEPPPEPAETILAAAQRPDAPPPVPQRAEINQEISNMVFTAVIPGPKPRLMYRGRVVDAGARVEGEVVFMGITQNLLVFKDGQGAIYTRRY